jgi:hypothetical protein
VTQVTQFKSKFVQFPNIHAEDSLVRTDSADEQPFLWGDKPYIALMNADGMWIQPVLPDGGRGRSQHIRLEQAGD